MHKDPSIIVNINLREAKLKIISDDVCKQPHVYGHDIKSGMFCAGYLEGIYDACRVGRERLF